MSVISRRDVEKSFGSWSLFQGVDLEVAEHARMGVVGPNARGSRPEDLADFLESGR